MVEYGYIENGFLRSKTLEPFTQKYLDEAGEVQTRTITIADQIAMLPPEYKPVDEIDESQMISDEEYFTIRIVPYDAGDRISFHYEKVVDNYKLNAEINALKDTLAATDYQVIKCYEASLTGEELPYDIHSLHTSRNEIRAQINKMQTTQASLLSL